MAQVPRWPSVNVDTFGNPNAAFNYPFPLAKPSYQGRDLPRLQNAQHGHAERVATEAAVQDGFELQELVEYFAKRPMPDVVLNARPAAAASGSVVRSTAISLQQAAKTLQRASLDVNRASLHLKDIAQPKNLEVAKIGSDDSPQQRLPLPSSSSASTTLQPKAKNRVAAGPQTATPYGPVPDWAKKYRKGSLPAMRLVINDAYCDVAVEHVGFCKAPLNNNLRPEASTSTASASSLGPKGPSLAWAAYAILSRVPGGKMTSKVLEETIKEWLPHWNREMRNQSIRAALTRCKGSLINCREDGTVPVEGGPKLQEGKSFWRIRRNDECNAGITVRG